MPVDTGIYSNIRPFTMADPYESAAKVMALRSAQKKYTLEDDVAQAASETGGDPERMAQALLSKGHYQPAMQLRTQAASLDKERRLAGNAEVDRKLKLAEAAGSDAMMLDTTYRQALQAAGGNREQALAAVAPIYQQARQKWAGMQVNLPESFDPDVNFSYIGQAKEAIQYLKTLAPEIQMTDTGGSITPTNRNPLAGPVGPLAGAQSIQKTPAPAAPTELARLQNELAAMPADDPRRAQHEKAIAGFKAGRATDVTVNTGPMAPGKTAGNKVDESMLETTQNLMQLDQIAGQFKPEYQTILTRGNAWWSSAKEKAGVDLKHKEKADLEEFSKYKRNAIDSLNKYIKSITGAAMTNAEADRILKGLPNPGSGLFDGDSPTEFKAKLDDAMKSTKMSVARLAYIKRNGMSLEDGQGNSVVPLERMPTIINERGKAIEEELKRNKPDADSKALGRAVRRQLSLEFGLSAD
jgi:hypothetical protein